MKLINNIIDKRALFLHTGLIGISSLSIVAFFIELPITNWFTNRVFDVLEPIVPYQIFGWGLVWFIGVIIPFCVCVYYINRIAKYILIKHKHTAVKVLFDVPILESQKRLNEFSYACNNLVKELEDQAQNYYKRARYFIPDSFMGVVPLSIGLFLVLFSDYGFQTWYIQTQTRFILVGAVLIGGYLLDVKSFHRYCFKKKEAKASYETAMFKCDETQKQYDMYIKSPFLDTENEDVSHSDGIVFQHVKGSYKGISYQAMYEHTFLIGPTGTGKSTKIIVPNLINSPEHSLIINDESSELLNLVTSESSYVSKEYRSEFQKRIIKQLNPTKPELSLKWNPLSDIKSYNDANRIAQCMITIGVDTSSGEASFWNDQATLLLTIALYFLYLDEKSVLTFINLKRFLALSRENMKELLRTVNEGRLIEDFMLGYGGAEDRVASSILNTVTTSIQLYFREDMQIITSETNFSFNQIRESNIALFLTTPVSERETYKPYFTLFLSECLNYLNSSEGRPVKVLLDEFGSSFGNIKGLSNHIATLRKKKVGLFLAVQSMAQLQTYYPKAWKTIVANCLTKVILSSAETEDCNYISKMCGKYSYPVLKKGVSEGSNINESVQKNSHTKSDSNSESFAIEIRNDDVIQPSELRELPKDIGVAVIGNSKPFLFKLKAYFSSTKNSNSSRESGSLPPSSLRYRIASLSSHIPNHRDRTV
jgi:type IV secretory pathway TraG/TraD family ATPase VirD4